MKLKRKENEAGFVDMLHKTMEKEDDIKHYYSCLSYEKKFYYSSLKPSTAQLLCFMFHLYETEPSSVFLFHIFMSPTVFHDYRLYLKPTHSE